ncbi:MAG: 3-phosphoshikimate 1-carboxyvinyltransferase [Armatimonadetes bacterium]|jgi:3-phosphoshikimate 1-carboxyvinyltransferase|nr:3-phosphoshikimate 1-carboxyvinyltransferase [Armatimonadota bacterium]
MKTLIVRGGRPLRGCVSVPGDKSISHRAALLGAVAEGVTRITGFLRGEDCLATLEALRALGVAVDDNRHEVVIHGIGEEGLSTPRGPLCVGNSGTLLRLLAGLVAGYPVEATLDGDASIRRRPMDRIAIPLRSMGARVSGAGDRCLPPVTVRGGDLRPISYTSPVASAQVKSCVFFAGLRCHGVTSVTEPRPSRDHTERMLEGFGAVVERNGLTVSVLGPGKLQGRAVRVPGDISSAAFYLVAGTVVSGSSITVQAVGVNPTRTGFLDILAEMGAPVRQGPIAQEDAEPVADLQSEEGALRGVRIGGDLVPRAIDELPVAALAACFADGPTRIQDAAELRVKESDRIASTARLLASFGVRVEVEDDGLVVYPGRLGPAMVDSGGDHRIAMTGVIAGLAVSGESRIRDTACIATSFPGFVEGLCSLGADVEEADD